MRLIRTVAVLVRVLPTFVSGCPRTSYGESGIVHGHVTQVELLTLQKGGQFPDESVRITV